MSLFFVVNDLESLASAPTTIELLLQSRARAADVFVGTLADLALAVDGTAVLRSARVPKRATARTLPSTLARASFHARPLAADATALVRINPGRAHTSWMQALEILSVAESHGARVWNATHGLRAALSKLYLHRLAPHLRPQTLVSRHADTLVDFVTAQGDRGAVLKPLLGTRGRDVFSVSAADTRNLRQTIDVIVRQGWAMAQSYVSGAERGDIRLLMLDGEPLHVGHAYAAVQRVPGVGDFRSNVSAGGTATPVQPSAHLLRHAREVGQVLRADGLRVVGLDFIGDQVIEVNAYAPGGLHDMRRFYDVDFSGPILDALLKVPVAS